MIYRITSWLAATLMLFSIQATAASLSDIRLQMEISRPVLRLALSAIPNIRSLHRASVPWRWILSRAARFRGYRCCSAATIW